MIRIFVIGSAHSGTTLLHQILGRHSDLLALPWDSEGVETKYFHFLPEIKRRFAPLSDKGVLHDLVRFAILAVRRGAVESLMLRLDEVAAGEVKQVLARLTGPPSYGSVLAGAADEAARAANCGGWVEKTPSHVFWIDAIHREIPTAKFLQSARDPRDVLASLKTRRQEVWTSERYSDSVRSRKHLSKAYDPFWDALSWRAAWRAGRKAETKWPLSVHVVSYESLVQQPEASAVGICRFVGVSYSADLLSVSHSNPADIRTRGKGILRSSVGRFSTVLRPSEIAVCQFITGRQMDELGYSRSSIGIGAALQACPLLCGSAWEFLIRLWRHTIFHGQYAGQRLGPAFGDIIRKYLRQVRSSV